MTPQKIVDTARKYLGQTEKNNNSGWIDPTFEAKMKAVGWQIGHSWCCYFTELVAVEAFAGDADKLQAFKHLFQASCTATYANFSGSSKFKVGKVPKVGALMVWRLGQGWKGHIGIVEEVGDGWIKTIEGNTNDQGGREGIEVARKRRRYAWTNGPGLNLIGFIYLC